MSPSSAPAPRPDDAAKEDAHQALDAVLRLQAEQAQQAARAASAKPPDRDLARKVIAALAFLFMGYVWIGNPSWLNPPEPPGPSPAQLEAGLRFAVYLESERVEQFRARHQRLPETLDQAGGVPEGIEYTALDHGRYRLVGKMEGIEVTFDSDRSVDEFLGSSEAVLARDGR